MLTLLFACATQAPQAPPADAATTLAAADAHDGQSDKVVHECGMCGLGMAGDPAFAVSHAGYTLHFCNESHQKAFEGDIPGGIALLQQAVAAH